MYKNRMEDKKGKETKYAHDSKMVYCIVKAEDTYNEITVQSFADNFKEHLDKIGFNWKHKNYPSADTIRNDWFKRWDWKGCAKKFNEDMLEEDDLLFTYKKSNAKHIIKMMKLRDDVRDELYYLKHNAFFESNDEKMKAINRCSTTLDRIEKEIRLLLGLSTSNNNVDANMEAKVETIIGEQNIFKYSDEEMERIQNISNDNEDFLDEL